MQNSDLQSQLSVSKLSESFYNFFSFKNIILGAQFLLLTFLTTSILNHLKHFNGLVVGFVPKGKPGKICDSVR